VLALAQIERRLGEVDPFFGEENTNAPWIGRRHGRAVEFHETSRFVSER
jgi:hypothetical protein